MPPQQYGGHRSDTLSAEDCRDYLRTGRCKYGASCKYSHPSNVQSGGGMKAPIDPTEPLFPVRPDEPLCQYYVKHGTCKFGQACKFNHPPQAPLQAVLNGGSVSMNAGASKSDSPQLVLNQVGSNLNRGSMMLQFLPQRPDESDCIFFLKNGCCKYGATCRYHHPMNYHQRRVEDTRRHQGPSPDMLNPQKAQYTGHAGLHPGFHQEKVVVADDPSSFMTFDGSSAPQGYQIITNDYNGSHYGTPVESGIITEQGSVSSTSIASSYETAGSNLEHLASQGDVGSAALWNRARKNGSGGSLGAYAADNSNHGRSQGNRVAINPSVSDGSISSRQHRAASNGSASDHSMTYYETPSTMSRSLSSGSWRNERPAPYEQSKRIPMSQYVARTDGMPPHCGVTYEQRAGEHKTPPSSGSRPPFVGPGQRRRSPRSGGHDEGFTMMTSALLNMLDTPDEVAENYILESTRHHSDMFDYGQELDPEMFEALSLNSARRDPGNYPTSNSVNSSWKPSWQQPAGAVDGKGVTRTPVLQSRGGPGSHAQNDGDVGLYLP